MSARETRNAARAQLAELQSITRPSLRGPARKWEKKWVQSGHLKIYKWVPVTAKSNAEMETANRVSSGDAGPLRSIMKPPSRKSTRSNKTDLLLSGLETLPRPASAGPAAASSPATPQPSAAEPEAPSVAPPSADESAPLSSAS
eukprot:TRINITY_DN27365_c0_g1_i1.p1 TRINITY_DN27365_c0_g1~~TRINITY_DN27365_c0_g1_i1.p1  ORF type:complete len:157 (-),score=2.93 TRINITY_DN27365_c0_g1_i1:255-686(-)